MAWAPAQNPGDTDPLISDAKRALGKFSYGKGLGTTDEYTVEFGVALQQWQINIHYQVAFKGRPGPDVNTSGVFDWAAKKQMRILPEDQIPAAKEKPWIIAVPGHMGAWDSGPAYLAAHQLEIEGRCRLQGVGYDNIALPFRNDTGFNELDRILREVVPPTAPFLITSHSQGGIVTSDYLEQVLLPGKASGKKPFVNFRGGVHWANPRRPRGVVAPWIVGDDRPSKDSEGLDPNCLAAAIPGMQEVSRRKDLYADKIPGEDAEYKEAVYLAVARNEWTGHNSMAEQIGELVTGFGKQVWPVFRAITGGVQFAVNMDPHNIFDLGPGIDHMRALLT
jgi:hypothetical protein